MIIVDAFYQEYLFKTTPTGGIFFCFRPVYIYRQFVDVIFNIGIGISILLFFKNGQRLPSQIFHRILWVSPFVIYLLDQMLLLYIQ